MIQLRHLASLTLVLVGAGALASAALRPAAQEGLPAPKPGPEHELLKKLAGEWDAKMSMGPIQEPAHQSAKVDLGGFWLLSSFEGQMMGQPFQGHEVLGWDTNKQKYVSCWVDSSAATLAVSEGTWDEATHTLTMVGEGIDPMSGEASPMYQVIHLEGPDKHVFEMRMGSADAPAMMTITYTRK